MKTIVYVRVSTKRQDARSQDADLKRWALANQVERSAFVLDKFTGREMTRPGWDRVAKAIADRDVDQLVVWRLDRLGRTAKGLTALFDDLYKKGINLVSLKEGIDLSTPAGRLMANVLASVAAYETEVRGERVVAGQAAARAAGKTWGGSEKGRRIKVSPEQINVVREMSLQGKSKASMCRATGLTRPTIYTILDDASAPVHQRLRR